MAYVTSDGYMGNTSSQPALPFQFRGRPALLAVLEDLFNGFQFNNKTYRVPAFSKFILTGFSAGGFGTLMNTNWAGSTVRSLCSSCSFYSLPDSGLFIGSLTDPLRTMAECGADVTTCYFPYEIQIAFVAWGSNTTVDSYCAVSMAALKLPLHRCFYGEIGALFVKEQMMVLQYMFDAAELLADGALNLLNMTQLQFAEELALTKKALFGKFPSFLPACLGHCMATPHALDSMAIDGTSLGAAISEWFYLGSKASRIDKCETPECRLGCA